MFNMETLAFGSTGPFVEFLQSILKKMDFFQYEINGVFNEETRNAVTNFQEEYGLITDGIVGRSTFYALSPYINGYEVYTVKNGDTFYKLASQFFTTLDRILIANPGIDWYNLRIGQKIIIPFGTIVPTDIRYTYDILKMNIDSLTTIYPFLKIQNVGNSELCREIPCIRLGNGSKEVFYNGSFHANEWITTPVLMKFIENYSLAYANNLTIYGYRARELFSSVSIYIIPMVNPDGVDLVTGAIRPDTAPYILASDIASNYSGLPFPQGWKANINGIDLNLQFPANWEKAREIKFAQGYVSPAPRDYVGPAPLSAKEAKAVYEFTLEHNFNLILAYHTQGRTIYWKYLDYLPDRSYYIGTQFANSSGYSLEETPYGSSFAGYKDWFIQEYNRPGYTIEAGIGVNPLPISQFGTIYSENEGILVLAAVLA